MVVEALCTVPTSARNQLNPRTVIRLRVTLHVVIKIPLQLRIGMLVAGAGTWHHSMKQSYAWYEGCHLG